MYQDPQRCVYIFYLTYLPYKIHHLTVHPYVHHKINCVKNAIKKMQQKCVHKYFKKNITKRNLKKTSQELRKLPREHLIGFQGVTITTF